MPEPSPIPSLASDPPEGWRYREEGLGSGAYFFEKPAEGDARRSLALILWCLPEGYLLSLKRASGAPDEEEIGETLGAWIPVLYPCAGQLSIDVRAHADQARISIQQEGGARARS